MQARVQDFPLHHRAPSSAGLAGWFSCGGIPILVAGVCLDTCFSLGTVLQSLKKCQPQGDSDRQVLGEQGNRREEAWKAPSLCLTVGARGQRSSGPGAAGPAKASEG